MVFRWISSGRCVMCHTSIRLIESGVTDASGRPFTSLEASLADMPEWGILGTLQWPVGVGAAPTDLFNGPICHLRFGEASARQQNWSAGEDIIGGGGRCNWRIYWHTSRFGQCSHAEWYEITEGAAQEVSIIGHLVFIMYVGCGSSWDIDQPMCECFLILTALRSRASKLARHQRKLNKIGPKSMSHRIISHNILNCSMFAIIIRNTPWIYWTHSNDGATEQIS